MEARLFNYTTNQKGGEGWTEYNLKHEHTEEHVQYLAEIEEGSWEKINKKLKGTFRGCHIEDALSHVNNKGTRQWVELVVSK